MLEGICSFQAGSDAVPFAMRLIPRVSQGQMPWSVDAESRRRTGADADRGCCDLGQHSDNTRNNL